LWQKYRRHPRSISLIFASIAKHFTKGCDFCLMNPGSGPI
jgi:hypothetical protein